MDPSAGEPPDKPGFHRAKKQLAPLGPAPGALHIVQNPFELGGGKVGVDNQTGFPADGIGQASLLQAVAIFRGPAALPDNGIAYRLSGSFVPDDGGFPLVGDADSGDIGCGSPQLTHGLRSHTELGSPDLPGIVLHPAGVGKDLRKFLLCGAADPALPVKQDTAIAGSPRIKRHHVLCHSGSSSIKSGISCLYHSTKTGKREGGIGTVLYRIR